MRVSRDPLQPLRSWKELLFGKRALKMNKLARIRDHIANAKATVLAQELAPEAQPATAD